MKKIRKIIGTMIIILGVACISIVIWAIKDPPYVIQKPRPGFLLPVQAKSVFLYLLKENGGCRLPCLWGITLGKDDRAAETTLALFGSKISIPDDIEIITNITEEKAGILIASIAGKIYVEQTPKYDIILWIDQNISFHASIYSDAAGEKDLDDPYYLKLMHYYTISEILTNYGPPDNVWLRKEEGDAINKIPMRINLLYLPESQGLRFFVSYYTIAKEEAENLIVCPAQSEIGISVDYFENQNANDKFLRENDFLPLNEVISMNMDDFYTTFITPNNTQCLEIPANVFP